VRDYQSANLLLERFLAQYNATHRVRTIGSTPDAAWRKAKREKRSLLRLTPPRALLDLHLAIVFSRRLYADHTIELFGQNYPVSGCRLKRVTIVLHPNSRFWVLPHPPNSQKPVWPPILASHPLPKTSVHF
jgi:hypothetical protein